MIKALLLLLATAQLAAGVASPYDASGIVTSVIDGGTFYVSLEGSGYSGSALGYASSSGATRVVLADLFVPDPDSPRGVSARDLTTAILLNKRVYLDIDDGAQKDPHGGMACKVYLSGVYGRPVMMPCFNRIMVDSGYASVNATSGSEFNPDDWWSGGPNLNSSKSGGSGLDGFGNEVENLTDDLLGSSSDQIINGINGTMKEAEGWLRGQLLQRRLV